MRVDLTGNPFVDTGLAVIAALEKLDDVQELTLEHIRDVHIHKDGKRIADWNGSMKNITMVFTNNSLLTNPAIKDKSRRITVYQAILNALVSQIGNEQSSYRCEACGASRSVIFDLLCRDALDEIEGKEETRLIGRDWFPLSGSLGSDAQALPAASRPINLCAKCLIAVHYLPLGLILLDGRLVVFQSTSIELWYELIRDIVSEVVSRVKIGNYDTLGSKEGSRAVARRLLGLFNRLQSENQLGNIQPEITLQVWRFTNSGPAPECLIEEIPNPALAFLWETVRQGLRHEIEALIDSEGKKERPFFRCIAEQRDYIGLYPSNRKKGTSPKLFALYQMKVCGRSAQALTLARMLALQTAEGLNAKELKRLQREEAFTEPAFRNQIRRLMANLTEEGKFKWNDYLELFPLNEEYAGIRVHFDGWKLIRYYLHHLDDSVPLKEGSGSKPLLSLKALCLHHYAAQIFRESVNERGMVRFELDVLRRMSQGGIGALWLQRQFLRLAEKHPGFNYENWEQLSKNDAGHLSISELLFQMRLLWMEWKRTGEPLEVEIPAFKSGSGLPPIVETSLREIFSGYVERRGLDRFHKDILLRLRGGEIGLTWFYRKLTDQKAPQRFIPLSEEAWENFLKDEKGHLRAAERLFRMHLMLANLYREALQFKNRRNTYEQ
jgi:CRISPR-associated protein Cst1